MPVPKDSILQRPQLMADQVVHISLTEIDAANAHRERPFTPLARNVAPSTGCGAGVKVPGGYRICWNLAVVSRFVPFGPAKPDTSVLRFLCESHRNASSLRLPASGLSWPRA